MNFVIVIVLFIMTFIVTCEDGKNISTARFPLPSCLRKVLFYIPQKYQRFTMHGLILLWIAHVAILYSLAWLCITGKQITEHSVNTMYFWWLALFFGSMMICGLFIIGNKLFGEKAIRKQLSNGGKETVTEYIPFLDGRVIHSLALSERTDNTRGLVIMLPLILRLDIRGNVLDCLDVQKTEGQNAFYVSVGNYEEMSSLFESEGYATLRLQFCENVERCEFETYLQEILRALQIIEKEHQFDKEILFAHGPLGSVTALRLSEEMTFSGIIMMGGVNVTPHEDLEKEAAFYHVKPTEPDAPFWKDVFAMTSSYMEDRLMETVIPTLAVYTSEEIVYHPARVKNMKKNQNPNIHVVELFGITSLWVPGDLTVFTQRGIEIKNGYELSVCKRVKKVICKWTDDLN